MGEVQPIRDRKKIKEMDIYLKGKSDRDHILWMVGLQSGLRISDIVKLRLGDALAKIKEKKTEKMRYLYLNDRSRKELQRYAEDNNISPEGWIFPSRRSDGKGYISTVQAYRILKEAGNAVGLENIGTHTMRKTFGYHYYRKTHDVATLMKIFNHASPSVTLRYIGIEREQIEDSLSDFYLL